MGSSAISLAAYCSVARPPQCWLSGPSRHTARRQHSPRIIAAAWTPALSTNPIWIGRSSI